MLIGIIFIFLIALFLTVLFIKTQYTPAFVISLVSLVLMLLSLMLYISKMTSYRYFFQIEFVLYRFIGDMKISFYDIKWLLNIAVVMFQLSMLLIYRKNTDVRRKEWRYIALYAVLSAVYLIINAPGTTERIYIYINKGTAAGEYMRSAVAVYGCIYMAIFPATAYFTLIRKYRSTALLLKKQNLCAVTVSMVLINILYLFIAFFTPIRFFINNVDVYDFLSINLIYNEHLYIYVPFIIIIVLFACMYILLKLRVFDDVRLLKWYRHNSNIKVLFGDMRHLFHSYKNAMLSIDFLTKKAVQNYGTDEGLEAIDSIQKSSAVFLKQATRFFEIYNHKLNLNLMTVSICDCIDSACNGINFADIEVEKKYRAFPSVDGDFVYLEEMFANILRNAVEALSTTEEPDKKICIEVWLELPWICVSIRDNGPGMSRKLMKNIFKPFASTKKSFKNWGIGLSFVKNVAEAHLGYVSVKSVRGEYSEFQVLLPPD